MYKLVILLIVSIGLLACQSVSTSQYLVLRGATLFDGDGAAIKNSIVIIQGETIYAVGDESLTIPRNSKVVDLSGKYIMPGMVDAHMHFFTSGYFDTSPEMFDVNNSIPFAEAQAYLRRNPQPHYEAYLRSGVTGVYDVGGFAWSIDRQFSAEMDANSPHVVASGTLLTPHAPKEIAMLNTSIGTGFFHLDSEQSAKLIVSELNALGATGIKLWGLAPEDEAYVRIFESIVEEVEKGGNKIIAHATKLNEAKFALRGKAKVLVHSVSDTAIDDEFIQLALQNDIVYVPTLMIPEGVYQAFRSLKGHEFIIDDPNSVVDARMKSMLADAKKMVDQSSMNEEHIDMWIGWMEAWRDNKSKHEFLNLKRAYDEGLTIAVGTDAANPGILHGQSIYRELEAMQSVGIAPKDLIVMATRNGAKAMGREDDFGTLAQGKFANLIILEADPSQDIANVRTITQVMMLGHLRSAKEKFID